MKSVLLAFMLTGSSLYAQGTFRIFDNQMNDVTGGVVYVSDTNATNMMVNLTVENIDTTWHEVTAGRLVITQPANASNAFTWASLNYPPFADSSAVSENMAPSGTAPFVGEYFPNNNGGLATINYCFWETGDMNNNSCVTVTFDNSFPAGTPAPIETGPPIISYWPNPATTWLGIGWGDVEIDRVDLFASDGSLISSSTIETGLTTEFNLTNLPEGMYYIHCSNADGFTFNFTFVHVEE